MRQANKIKVVSFDVEGTLVTPRFSESIWHEAMPKLYAEKNNLSLEQAKERIKKEYDRVGEYKTEWYDIKYWFKYFGFSDYQGLLNAHRREVFYYPEVRDVLHSLGKKYRLIVMSGSPREFLNILLADIEDYFSSIFSSISDCSDLKGPNFYLQVCRRLGIAPNEMAHVGDNRDFDYLAPRQAGIRAFYLDRDGKREGGDAVKDLRELWAHLAASESNPFVGR
jgi:putative hydrolase of the HAD superfamily